MSSFLDRVKVEAKELREKVIKLYDFIESENFSKLTEEEQEMLKRQKVAMEDYGQVLEQRIIYYTKTLN